MKRFDFHNLPGNFPFQGTHEEFEKLILNLNFLNEKIKNSENQREIIFESWFIFDYLMRRMILSGLQLSDFENEKLDLMYGLLPQSFDSCLNLFENILINQRDIYSNKKHPNTFFEFQENTLDFKGSFIVYLMNEKKDLFDAFFIEYFNFLKDQEPQYHKNYNEWDYSIHNIYKIVNKSWIDTCTQLDDNWFKAIRKLNKCRNKAAHLYDDQHIYDAFGINGKDKLKQLKITVSDLIKQTLNINF